MKAATDWDHRIITSVSVALGGRIGGDDDVNRLIDQLRPSASQDDRERVLAEIAVAFIRWAQDLKDERQAATPATAEE